MEPSGQTSAVGEKDLEREWELKDEELDRNFGQWRACVTVSTGEFTKH